MLPEINMNGECGMRNAESIQFVFIPNSEFRIPKRLKPPEKPA